MVPRNARGDCVVGRSLETLENEFVPSQLMATSACRRAVWNESSSMRAATLLLMKVTSCAVSRPTSVCRNRSAVRRNESPSMRDAIAHEGDELCRPNPRPSAGIGAQCGTSRPQSFPRSMYASNDPPSFMTSRIVCVTVPSPRTSHRYATHSISTRERLAPFRTFPIRFGTLCRRIRRGQKLGDQKQESC